MNLKTTALKEPLSNGPGNVLPENHAKPQLKTTALKSPLDTAPTQVTYGANTPNGKIQTSSFKPALNMKPQKGYESANTPMSNRAVDQSKGY